MPALFRKDLILDLDAGRAGALKQPDRSSDIERIAEAGIGVRQNRDVDRIGNGRNVFGKLTQRDEANIRHAQAHVRDPGAGHVESLKPVRRNDAREQRIRRSGKDRSTP